MIDGWFLFYVMLFLGAIVLVVTKGAYGRRLSRRRRRRRGGLFPRQGHQLRAKIKGALGERSVIQAIEKGLDREVYKVINDVTITCDGGTTQIDHVIVSVHGVFSIETKNMKGTIYGRAKDKNWTQSVGRKKFQFQNPIRQNYKHTQALKETLGLSDDQVHGIVVFAGRGKFAKDKPDNVVRVKHFTDLVKNYGTNALEPAQVDQVLITIENTRLAPGARTDKTHVRNLKERRLN